MMGEKVGILVISYGSRAAAVIDALSRSEKYEVRFYVADKQRNPFNAKHAEKHVVIPDLDVGKICDFVATNKNEIDFGICCPEKPIIEGVRDVVESKTGVAMICPTKRYAMEESKISQRLLLEECCVEANPGFKVFPCAKYSSVREVKLAVWEFLDEIGNEVAVKPDKPAAGKGVGVWSNDFTSREQLFEHFLSIFDGGSDVIIEEKIEGEESSFQAFCDGKRLSVLPDARDYKRAFDADTGPNTGGMGSYKDNKDWLPFMKERDREEEERLVQKIFKKLRGNGSNEELRGIPFYVGFMHTAKGAKILEINSRPGDPEIQNVLPVLKNDFVDVCFRMIEGNLSRIECEEKATVVTYAVPIDYGGYRVKYSGDKRVDLSGAYALQEKYDDNLRIYPGSMELREDGYTYALGSRTVCTVGVGETIAEAREISLDGIRNIDGALWNRGDIGAKYHIQRSVSRWGREPVSDLKTWGFEV
jgi:phosphoribosylamine--glycine ligase